MKKCEKTQYFEDNAIICQRMDELEIMLRELGWTINIEHIDESWYIKGLVGVTMTGIDPSGRTKVIFSNSIGYGRGLICFAFVKHFNKWRDSCVMNFHYERDNEFILHHLRLMDLINLKMFRRNGSHSLHIDIVL